MKEIKFWPCDHIKWLEGIWVFIGPRIIENFSRPLSEWEDFCGICGARRSSEKSLQDELATSLKLDALSMPVKDWPYADGAWKNLAHTAIKWCRQNLK